MIGNIKKEFQRLVEIFKDKQEDSDGILSSKLYKGLGRAGCLDQEYNEHLEATRDKYSPNSEHPYYALIPHIQDLTFDECCAMLTFVLRAERWSDGWFDECLSNGNIYELLSRACEVISQEEID